MSEVKAEKIETKKTEAAAAVKKPRRRAQSTQFGRSLRSAVRAVHPVKLAMAVGKALGQEDAEKVASSIASMVRAADANEGVLSVRREPLVHATLDAIAEAIPEYAPIVESLRKQFRFQEFTVNRDSATNWLVRLKAGEEVRFGDSIYKLTLVRTVSEEDEDEVPAAEVADEPTAE